MFAGELVELPPGPALGELLASVDWSRYGSEDLFRFAELQAKQVAHEQARLLEVMLEATYAYGGEVKQEQRRVELFKQSLAKARSGTVDGKGTDSVNGADSAADADCGAGGGGDRDGGGVGDGGGDGGPVRWRELGEFSGDQVAMSLVMSRSYAQGQVFLAKDLMERLPVVFAALREGRIDRVRAEVFSDALAQLDDVTARQIAEREIGLAASRIPGQLRRRLYRQVIKANPGLARERYDKTVTNRYLFLQPYTDGTAQLSAINLPPAAAVAAFNRVDRIARAAKSSGDVRTLPQLRADAALDLLSGRPFMLSPSLDPLTEKADQAARNLGYGVDDPDDLAGPTPPPRPRNRPGTRTSTKTNAAKAGAAKSGAAKSAGGAGGTGTGSAEAGTTETGAGLGAGAGSGAGSGVGDSGVHVAAYKTLAFVVSAFYTGVAGGLFAFIVGYLSPDAFDVFLSVDFVAMIVVGGLGSIPGSIVGAAVITVLYDTLAAFQNYRPLIFGAILIASMLFMPGGIASAARRISAMAGYPDSGPPSRPTIQGDHA